jgi:predicted DNA-binding protein
MKTDKELRVRLPPELWERLDRFTVDTHRSLTHATTLLLKMAFAQIDEDEPKTRRVS